MLMLFRRVGESIVIDLRAVDLEALPENDRFVELKVHEIHCGDDHRRVRIGFEAHRSIPIDRKEISKSVEHNGRLHAPRDLTAAAPRLLAVVQQIYDNLNDLPALTPQGRKLLAEATLALRIAEPHKFD